MNDTRHRDLVHERTTIQELVNWLHDGRELDRLEKLVAEARANPRKRTHSRAHVRNPDGSIYRRPRSLSESSVRSGRDRSLLRVRDKEAV